MSAPKGNQFNKKMNPKCAPINLRVTRDMKIMAQYCACEKDVTLSVWIEEAIKKQIKKDLER